MSYDPERGGARDLPRERYVRGAYRLLRRQGADRLVAIAERGMEEFVRVAGTIFGANGFVMTKDELRAMFTGIERQAVKVTAHEKRLHGLMDKYGRGELHGQSDYNAQLEAAFRDAVITG